jgi:hypothetical protein
VLSPTASTTTTITSIHALIVRNAGVMAAGNASAVLLAEVYAKGVRLTFSLRLRGSDSQAQSAPYCNPNTQHVEV